MVPLTSCKKTLDILLTKNKHAFEAVSILRRDNSFIFAYSSSSNE